MKKFTNQICGIIFLIIILIVKNNSVQAEDWGALSNGTIHIILSSHQDLGWYDSIPYCRTERTTNITRYTLGWMSNQWSETSSSDYNYSMEYVMALKDYLDKYPTAIDNSKKFNASGNYEWGGSYNCTYESMYSSEALVRQMYLGRKWLKKTLGEECDTHSYWNVDPPARSLQMAQILNKAGIKYLMTSRMRSGIFKWSSPNKSPDENDSTILVYSNGKYDYPSMYSPGIDGGMLVPYSYSHQNNYGTAPEYPKDLTNIIKNIHAYWAVTAIVETVWTEAWEEYYTNRNFPAVFPIMYTTDMLYPSPYFTNLIHDWKYYKENVDPSLPDLKMSTCKHALNMFYASATNLNSAFDEISGERPNVWVYIQGPSHHWALDAMRHAGRVLPAAETFATIESILSADFSLYPYSTLAQGWANAIYADHGWGGYDGDQTDATFLTNALKGCQIGEELLNNSIASIASRVDVGITNNKSIIIFNTLSWERNDPVVCTVGPGTNGWHIADSSGNPIMHQVLRSGLTLTNVYTGQVETNMAEIVFIAENIPSLGYKTYYQMQGDAVFSNSIFNGILTENKYSNQFYSVQLTNSGIISLLDVDLNREIFATNKMYGSNSFFGTELFNIYSKGFGAGEFAAPQQPVIDSTFQQLGNMTAVWSVVENGPVRDAYQYQTWFSDSSAGTCSISQKLIFYRDTKKIDIEINLLNWDGTLYREWRMALPLAMDKGRVTYEVPMGVVRVGLDEIQGAAGGLYTQQCAMINPRSIQNFIDVSSTDNTFGVTLASSVAVCNYLFPPSNDAGPDANGYLDNPILQPILLATRESCNQNTHCKYRQAGDHYFNFSILSHEGDWRNGKKFGVQANNPLLAVVGVESAFDATLTETKSFCSVSPDNVIISAFKKRDDDSVTPEGGPDENIIVRMYDMEGVTTQAQLNFFFDAMQVRKTDIIEEYLELEQTAKWPVITNSGQSVSMEIGHHSIETIVLTEIPEPTFLLSGLLLSLAFLRRK